MDVIWGQVFWRRPSSVLSGVNELCSSGMSHEGDGWTVQDGEQFVQSPLAHGFSPGRGTSNHGWPDSGVAKAEETPEKELSARRFGEACADGRL